MKVPSSALNSAGPRTTRQFRTLPETALYLALMWMDERGVAHTVSLPNPAELMSDRFRASLDALISMRPEEVAGLLERMEDAIYEHVSSIPVDGAYEHRSPPQDLLDDEVWSEQELETALEQVDLRWRLDAVLAVGNYID